MEENKKLFIAALVVMLGGNASGVINSFNPNIRSDPFTGSDGQRLEDRIETLELDVAQCQRQNGNHRESQAGALAKMQSDVSNNRYLIERCMNVVGG